MVLDKILNSSYIPRLDGRLLPYALVFGGVVTAAFGCGGNSGSANNPQNLQGAAAVASDTVIEGLRDDLEKIIELPIEGAELVDFGETWADERGFGELIETVSGEGSRTGNFFSHSYAFTRAFDWRNVDLSGKASPFAEMLAQAKVYDTALSSKGLVCVTSYGRDVGNKDPFDERDNIHISHQSSHESKQTPTSGVNSSGSGGYNIGLKSEQMILTSIYTMPSAAVTVFIRMEYDASRKVLFSEFFYSNKTVKGIQYPPNRFSFSQKIDSK
ncbi:hypothetical protein ACFLYT_00995 [Nanoarchaeota archaeon]